MREIILNYQVDPMQSYTPLKVKEEEGRTVRENMRYKGGQIDSKYGKDLTCLCLGYVARNASRSWGWTLADSHQRNGTSFLQMNETKFWKLKCAWKWIHPQSLQKTTEHCWNLVKPGVENREALYTWTCNLQNCKIVS